jgi:uridine kinase
MSRPSCLVGVAGGTGSGKTAIVRGLVERFGAAVIDVDAYYVDRGDLGMEERRRVNYDEPTAIDSDLLIRQVAEVSRGRIISKPVYSFETHRRVGSAVVMPAPLTIVDGLFALWWSELRALLDLKVFVEAPADLRLIRRLRRDMRERARTVDEVLDQYLGTVAPMHERYVEPCRTHADLVIANTGPLASSLHPIVAALEQTLPSLDGRRPRPCPLEAVPQGEAQ